MLIVENDSVQGTVSVVSYEELPMDVSMVNSSIQSRVSSFLYLLNCDLNESSVKALGDERRRMRRGQTKVPGFSGNNLAGSIEKGTEVFAEGIVKM